MVVVVYMYVVVIGAKINSAKARSSATFGYFSCFSLPLHAIAHRPNKKPELSVVSAPKKK